MIPNELTLLMERLVRHEMSSAVADMMWPGPTASLEDHVHRLVEKLGPVIERAEQDAVEAALRERRLAGRRAAAALGRARRKEAVIGRR